MRWVRWGQCLCLCLRLFLPILLSMPHFLSLSLCLLRLMMMTVAGLVVGRICGWRGIVGRPTGLRRLKLRTQQR